MNLDQEIFKVLVEAGCQGLKIEKVARHVFNTCNTMFHPLQYEDVHAYVTQYLTKCAKNPKSVIEKCKRVGVYRINYQSDAMQQLMLNFSPAITLEEEKPNSQKEVDKTPFCADLFG